MLLQTLIEGAMTDYTEEGMKIAQETLVSAYRLSTYVLKENPRDKCTEFMAAGL